MKNSNEKPALTAEQIVQSFFLCENPRKALENLSEMFISFLMHDSDYCDNLKDSMHSTYVELVYLIKSMEELQKQKPAQLSD